MDARRVEEAGLNSWPARQQMLFDGWIARFADSYTKRANSVTPLYPPLLPAESKVAFFEDLYERQQLPMVFRLPSFVPDSLKLDELLAGLDYRKIDLTLVLGTD